MLEGNSVYPYAMASRLPPLLLPLFIGLVLYTISEVRGEGLPLCQLGTMIPCINAAIESYVRNTVPENPEAALMDPQVSLKVATVMGTGLRNPKSDINATCEVLENIDTKAMIVCLEEQSKGCTLQAPAGTIPDLLPSLAGLTVLDSAVLAPAFCSTGCKNYPLAEASDNIITCLKASTEVLQTAVTVEGPALTEEQCGVLERYIYCTWNNSVGCQFLEETSRDYLQTLEEAASTCSIVFPSGVFPTATPTRAITSKGTTVTPQSRSIFILSVCLITRVFSQVFRLD